MPPRALDCRNVVDVDVIRLSPENDQALDVSIAFGDIDDSVVNELLMVVERVRVAADGTRPLTCSDVDLGAR